MSKKVAFYTLGCRVNQYETEVIEEIFQKNGYTVSDFNEKCDIYIINTCAVTVESERKSRQIIRRARSKNENAIIGVIGCSSQLQPEKSNDAGADIILGTSDKTRIAELSVNALEGNLKLPYIDTDKSSKPECDSYKLSKSKRAREFVKIEDGCNGKCAYCTIAKARGEVRSKKASDVISEIENLVQYGCKEVTLTGIELSGYEFGLCDLIKRVNDIKGLYGIRLGSLEPTLINGEFLNTVNSCNKLLPHYHISLQSGCTQTLNRMRRKYNAECALKNISELKKINPDITLSCDLIVGFPGETDDEFNKTLDFLTKVGFLHIHAFPYSKRPGTAAYDMQNQIDGNIKQERMKIIEALDNKSRCEILDKAFKKDYITALIESSKKGIYSAHTDNFIDVSVKSDINITEKILKLKPVSHDNEKIIAKII